jgi:hypothetical protein
MMLLWQKRANRTVWLTGVGREAACLAAAGGRGGPPAPVFPSQPVDGLERAVPLNDSEEDLGWRILHLRSDGDEASADIEPADLVDGPQQPARVMRQFLP